MTIVDDLADMMPDTVTLSTVASRDDYGVPTYNTGVEFVARVVRRHRLVRTVDGDEVISTAQVWIAGCPTISPDDQIELSDGSTPPILAVEKFQDENGPSHVKIALR